MATIKLYANSVNQMAGLIENIGKSVKNYEMELFSVKQRVLQVNQSICDLQDVANSIRTSSRTQEQKQQSLQKLQISIENFIDKTTSVDCSVADLIKQRKNDFYEKYKHLKPEHEKNGWDKFCENCKKAGEWCQEHWRTITTAAVVIGIALLAVVTFGIAVSAIAAIAGIISLVLCVADVICMISTGGKDLATVFREKGWNVLADVFQGLQMGCDIVSIAFPAGAAIKMMTKIGVKSFAKASFHAVKVTFKETMETLWKKGFQISFKDGMKNLGKVVFKTCIFDIDDFTNVRNGRRVWSLKEDTVNLKGPTKNWTIKGDELIPQADVVPKRNNPLNLSMEEIMKQEKFKEFPNTLSYQRGNVKWADISVAETDLNMKRFDISQVIDQNLSSSDFSRKLRDFNFKNAEKELFNQRGVTVKELEQAIGYRLTWHEDLNMKKCYLVPTEIHANIGHTGAVANYKFNFSKIPDLSRLVGDKLTQFGFRYGLANNTQNMGDSYVW